MTISITGIAKAAVVALALGGGAIATAAPAQAQPSFSFQFGFGNNGGQMNPGFGRLCLSDSQLRRAIRDQGYRNVALNVERGNRIQARGTRGGWVYLLEVNSCSGRILDRERLRRA